MMSSNVMFILVCSGTFSSVLGELRLPEGPEEFLYLTLLGVLTVVVNGTYVLALKALEANKIGVMTNGGYILVRS